LRKLQLVEGFAVEIPDQPTLTAHEVVVSTEIPIESGTFAGWAECRDQAEIAEQPECPINRIQRHCRDPFANGPVDRPRIGVAAAFCDLAEDLRPLVGELDTSTSAHLLETLHSALDFALVHFSQWSLESE
jgi:hypothetical protein